MLKTRFFLLFKPAINWIGRFSFFNKVQLISFFLILPLVYSSLIIYAHLDTSLRKTEKNLDDLEKNYALYKMIFLVQDYEVSATMYLDSHDSAQSTKQLEKSEERMLGASENLLSCLDDRVQSYCSLYYEQAHLSFLSKNLKKLAEYTQEYKYFLYKKINSIDLEKFSKSEDSLDKIAYLLSVELPFSTLLMTDIYTLSSKDELLLKVGKFEGSVEKTNLTLEGLSSYPNYFESDNLKYKKSVAAYKKHVLAGDERKTSQVRDSVLSMQLSLFNTLQTFLESDLKAEQNRLQRQINIFILFVSLCGFLGLYLFIGAYLSLRSSLQEFFNTAQKISKGKLNARIDLPNTDELGRLSKEFNKMLESLDYHYTLLDEYKRAVDSSAIIVKTDQQGIITYVNEAYENLSGYSKKELIGSSHRLIKSKNTTNDQIVELWKYINNKQIYKTIFENICKNGKSFFVESTIVPILSRSGDINEFIAIMFDITPLYRQKERLQSQLYKDELTSLPNRLKLVEDITFTKEAKLVVINIDRFKEINAIYGESIGDLTLQKMAKEIKGALNTRHLQLYKLSADEFAILAGKEISNAHFKEDVAMLAHYLSYIKLECAEHQISVRLSLGACISEVHETQRPLISMADMALKEAKRRMRPYLFYSDISLSDKNLEKNYKMVQMIEQAIKDEKIGCLYQGIINSKTGKIEKYETLMRLEDDKGHKISPQDFVGIAKGARYYPKLTQRVFQEALFTFMKRSESVSINLSVDDIMDDDTYIFILDALRNCGCSKRVIFELLETEEIEFNERVLEFTSQVKKLGAQIAIDDFGSGYSNYAYLMKLGVDIIKIDASLIKDVHTDKNSRLIVRSIIDIAHDLGMKTVAEHVHTQEIEDIMKEMGVDFLQGYHLHKPVAILTS